MWKYESNPLCENPIILLAHVGGNTSTNLHKIIQELTPLAAATTGKLPWQHVRPVHSHIDVDADRDFTLKISKSMGDARTRRKHQQTDMSLMIVWLGQFRLEKSSASRPDVVQATSAKCSEFIPTSDCIDRKFIDHYCRWFEVHFEKNGSWRETVTCKVIMDINDIAKSTIHYVECFFSCYINVSVVLASVLQSGITASEPRAVRVSAVIPIFPTFKTESKKKATFFIWKDWCMNFGLYFCLTIIYFWGM